MKQNLHDCKVPQQTREGWQINCVFRLSLGLSTQIMAFEYKQAYKKAETGVLVWFENQRLRSHINQFFLLW